MQLDHFLIHNSANLELRSRKTMRLMEEIYGRFRSHNLLLNSRILTDITLHYRMSVNSSYKECKKRHTTKDMSKIVQISLLLFPTKLFKLQTW